MLWSSKPPQNVPVMWSAFIFIYWNRSFLQIIECIKPNDGKQQYFIFDEFEKKSGICLSRKHLVFN